MTRSWPMQDGVAGEALDHPHHESIWFTHGRVNGVDFWTSHPGSDKASRRDDHRIEQVELVRAEGGREGVIYAEPATLTEGVYASPEELDTPHHR